MDTPPHCTSPFIVETHSFFEFFLRLCLHLRIVGQLDDNTQPTTGFQNVLLMEKNSKIETSLKNNSSVTYPIVDLYISSLLVRISEEVFKVK